MLHSDFPPFGPVRSGLVLGSASSDSTGVRSATYEVKISNTRKILFCGIENCVIIVIFEGCGTAYIENLFPELCCYSVLFAIVTDHLVVVTLMIIQNRLNLMSFILL